MRTAPLIRDESSDHGTLGALAADGGPPLHVMEPPWRGNARNRSRIPPGAYRVLPHVSPRFGRSAPVARVPGRNRILVHAGNLGGSSPRPVLSRGERQVRETMRACARSIGAIFLREPERDAAAGADEARWPEQPAGMLEIAVVPGSLVAPAGPAFRLTHRVRGFLAPPGNPTGFRAEAPLGADLAGVAIRYPLAPGEGRPPPDRGGMRPLHEGPLAASPSASSRPRSS